MTVFDCVLNNFKDNILFIGPEGYGKTTQFINCYKKILETKNSIVPIYIDLADAEVISSCRNGSMFPCILSKYCGVEDDLSNGVFRLKELLKKENKYTFFFFVDHFETAIKNEIYNCVSCEISELSKFENCCTIVSSTYYDDRIFCSFKRFGFLPLPKETVVSYIDIKSRLPVTENSISERQFNVLTIPQWLYEYGEMLEQEKNALFMEFDSDVELLTKKFDCQIAEILNEFKITCELAFYCVKNNSFVVPYSELKYFFDNDVPLHKRFLIALKHFTNGKNEDPLEKLNRISKKYGYGQLCGAEDALSEVTFVFSKQMYVDYFAAEYCYSLLLGCEGAPGKLEFLNSFIISEEVARMVALNLKKSGQREILIDVLDRIATFNKNLYEGEMPSLDSSKFLYLTTNLVNINFYINKSFANTNFSYLDLRLCNFIGKNCNYADFTKAFVSDECFVPVEPEYANFFAVSDNGKFLVSGDKTALNIRSIDYPIVIDSVLCENEDEFIKVKFINETTFEAICKKRVIVVNITDETSNIRELEQADMLQEESKRTDNNSFSNYGIICYSNEKYAVVKSSGNSYYGQAYLLFEIKTRKLIAWFHFHSHMNFHAIVQRGDEINFLYPNSDKPLKALCYNEKTTELFRKQYPSMIGRGVAYEDGKRIFFDTDKYDSYLKFYFSNLPTKKREADWIDKENSEHYVISKSKSYYGHKRNIVTDMFRYKIFDDLIVYDDKTDDGPYYWLEFSKYTYDFGIERIFEQYKNLLFGVDFNIIKTNDEYRFHAGNSVYSCWLDGDNIKTNLLYNIELCLDDEYVAFIDAFPWFETLSFIVEKFELPQLLWQEFLSAAISPITKRIFTMVAKATGYEYCGIWNNSVGGYLSAVASYYYFNKNEIPSSEEIISKFKKYCTVCNDGVTFFDGKFSRFLRFENGGIVEITYGLGALTSDRGINVRFMCNEQFYNKSRYYHLVDVYKDFTYNSAYAPRIPIYDLELFSANTDGMIGISPLCKDILKKQTKIETRFIELAEEE